MDVRFRNMYVGTDAAPPGNSTMDQTKPSYRIVTRGETGEFRTKTYDSPNDLLEIHTQIGVDDCSTNLSLRGLPVFKGLIGPMSDEDNVVRYESPDVFEALTKEWVADQPHKRKRRRKATAEKPAETTAEIS